MPIYQSAEPFWIYVECTVWGNFFLLAFCHLPFMDEKLVPPSQLLHGLCPFVLSHKGSSLTFVFLQCVLTQVSRLHALLFLCTRISVIHMFIYCKEGVPDQLLQSGDCITVCSMVVLQSFFFFFFSCFDLHSPGAEVWFIGCSKGSFADEGTGKVIDSGGRKICLLQVNVSQQTLSYGCLVGLFCKMLFHYDYDDQHVEVYILTQHLFL